MITLQSVGSQGRGSVLHFRVEGVYLCLRQAFPASASRVLRLQVHAAMPDLSGARQALCQLGYTQTFV